uniref:Uncharacterized protein n=1 Tax=viral metagenome TaxID=1070528 RepID=A0A6H1ZYG6_9ZZZZ
MEIQGQILSIRHAPTIVNENKVLKARVKDLEWLVQHQINEIETLKSRVAHFQTLILLEGKDRKKLSKARNKTVKLQTRRGWIPPE